MRNIPLLSAREREAWNTAVALAAKTLGKGKIYWHTHGKQYTFPTFPIWYFTKPTKGAPWLIVSSTGETHKGEDNANLKTELHTFAKSLIRS